MNDRGDMDRQHARLLHLYDEDYDEQAGTGETLPTTAEENDELTILREMKELMEARPRVRPDADVVDIIVASARGETGPESGRRDRAPERRRRSVRLRVGAASAAAVLVLLVGLFQWTERAQESSGEGRAAPQTAERMTGGEEAGRVSVERPIQERDGPSTAAASSESGMPSADGPTGQDTAPGTAVADAAEETVPDWDERQDVIELHQRIERIGSGVDQGWEAPAVPLEMLPANEGRSGIVPAGQAQ